MGKEEIECVLCKTYSHSVLSVIAIMLPLPSVCLWHVAHASARASLYKQSTPPGVFRGLQGICDALTSAMTVSRVR